MSGLCWIQYVFFVGRRSLFRVKAIYAAWHSRMVHFRAIQIRHFAEFDRQQNLRFISNQTSQLGTFMMCSSNRVLCLTSFRFLQWILSSALGFSILPIVVIFGLIFIPSILALLNEPLVNGHVWDTLGILLHYGLFIVILYLFPRIAWLRLIEVSDDLDKLFVDDNDRNKYIKYVDSRLRFLWQVVVGVLSVLFSLSAVYIFSPFFDHLPLNGISLYFFAGVVTWFASNEAYWLWVVPNIIHQLYKIPHLNLSFIAPAYTPAFLSLSRLLSTSALLAILGMLVITAPVLIYTLYFGSGEVLTAVVVVMAVGMCTVLFVGLAPQLWLAKAARRHKEQSLDDITRIMGGYGLGVPKLMTDSNMLLRTYVLAMLHKDVQQAGVLALQIEVLVKYLIALISALSPIIAVILRNQKEFLQGF
jgi:hypothetical protein